jgi:subtilase family serine protease
MREGTGARVITRAVMGALALLAAAGCGGSEGMQEGPRRPAPRTAKQFLIDGPDFVVTGVSGPVSARLGDYITAQVTVCNEGNQGDSTYVDVYLSQDQVIGQPVPPAPPTDVLLGSGSLYFLEPGQCQTVSVFGSVWVDTAGAYYLGAVADPFNNSTEPNEANNAAAGDRIGLGDLSDFTVVSVKGPASVSQGQGFSTLVRVCNQGTQPDSTYVELYLSQDQIITLPPPAPPVDFPVGAMSTDYLYPGQCQTVEIQGSAWTGGPGPHYLAAAVDPYQGTPELIEDNNITFGRRMGVGDGADFEVVSVKGPASVTTGGFFTAQVKVCNQGTMGDSTSVDLYLSSDPIISPPVPPAPPTDYLVENAGTGYLQPGQCQTVAISGPAWVSPSGAYYLGAVVDPYNSAAELIEDNNSLAGGRMGVGSYSDFTVEVVTGPASVFWGDSLTAQVKVCNRGTEPDSTYVDVYLSPDPIIAQPVPPAPPSDFFVGSMYTDYLYPGQCQQVPVAGWASVSMEGAYYLGARVDPYDSSFELIEDNNTQVGGRIGVGWYSDFTVRTVQGPASVQPGDALSAQVEVCNQGRQGDSTQVELYLSRDEEIVPYSPYVPPHMRDDFVGYAYTNYLDPGQCEKLTIAGWAWAPSNGVYYVGAAVDPYNGVYELIEDNNTLAGNRIGIGWSADFVVESVKGPASAEHGQHITTQVKVCNQGTEGDSTFVEVYLSEDTEISPPVASLPPHLQDQPVGYAYTDYLYPGQCQTLAVSGPASAYVMGPHYLGAVVDPYRNNFELIEDNNATAGSRIGMGYDPDFVVERMSGPASATQGQTLTAQVKVCNQGTQSGESYVAVYLSSDAEIVPPDQDLPPFGQDQFIGELSTGYLEPGRCQTVSVMGSAWVYPEGPWYLGAVVDPYNYASELIDDNNARAGNRMGVGSDPDFVVESVTGPVSAQQGQQITAQVKVCNQGTTGSSAPVDLYLSPDAELTLPTPPHPPADFFVGSEFIGYLEAGQCQTVPISGPAWVSTYGSYYLGAAVDAGDSYSELIEDNNTTVGSRMGVGDDPDFVVERVTGPASAQHGQQITAQVKVCNQGTVSGETQVELYLSTDAEIVPPTPGMPPHLQDQPVTVASTNYLNPGQCQTLAMSGSAWTFMEGAHYLGAAADPYNYVTELIDDNNTRAGNRMGVGNDPDFVVERVTGPVSAGQGEYITAQVKVCNQGTMGDSTSVDLYLSSDAIIEPFDPSLPAYLQDWLVGEAFTNHLNPGQCQTLSISGSVWANVEGAHYLGAVVDPHNGRPELLEDNNATTGNRMGVGNDADFVVTTVTGPASTPQGGYITAQVQVCNQGTQGDGTQVELYLSSDANIEPYVPGLPPNLQDQLVGSWYTDYLFPGQCQTLPISGPASTPLDGAYYLGAVADPLGTQLELIEDNNAKAGNRIGVGGDPDFLVASVTGPTSMLAGDQITTQVKVCNQGTVGDSAHVQVLLSQDTVITAQVPPAWPTDVFVTDGYTDYLNPGQCQTLSLSGAAWPEHEGPYYVGAVVDPQNYRPELIEDNNATAGNRIGVGSDPDFVVESVKGPASMEWGQPITAQVKVCNQGTQADSSYVEVYLSQDAVITATVPPAWPTDVFVTDGYTDHLNPGQCQTLSLSGTAWPEQEGPYYLGAVADPRNYRPELIEDNNATAGNRIGVGSDPDFMIASVTGPANAQNGDPITAQVKVCNQGTQGDSAQVSLFVSQDTVVPVPLPPGGPTDFFVGDAYSDFLPPGQCQTLSISGPAWANTNGVYHLVAAADPNNYRPELIEDNNTLAGSRMGLGWDPDFVVERVTGPASADQGDTITAQVKVCNQGTQGDSSFVELYLSQDTVITAPMPPGPPADFFVGGAATYHLEPGQCQTLSISGSVWTNVNGAHYLGAVVDPSNSRNELQEDNNATAGSRIGVGADPDFVVERVSGPASAEPGQPVTAQVKVCNQGTQADSSYVEVYLSEDEVISPMVPGLPPYLQDSPVGGAPTELLNPGQCQTLAISGSAWVDDNGVYYLGAVVDPSNSRNELVEDNNTTLGNRVGVGSDPDFVVESVKGPPSAGHGQPITTQVKVCNQGTQAGSAFVGVYVSTDTLIEPPVPGLPPHLQDAPAGGAPTDYLEPGRCQTVSISGSVWVDTTGAHYLGAVVDPSNSQVELIEDNNATVGNRIGVGDDPDFMVAAVTGPPSAEQGQQITAQAKVCNLGTQPGVTYVEVYVSADVLIERPVPGLPPELQDTLVGNVPTDMLEPGQCQTLAVTGPAWSHQDGAFYLGALVDPNQYQPELIEDNNMLAGSRIGIGWDPDFMVESVKGPPSAEQGQTITTQVKVCNQGTQPGATQVEVYVSADELIERPVPGFPASLQDQFVGSAPTEYLEPGRCQTVSVTGPVWGHLDGAYYLGAVVDPLDHQAELIEDNNATAGSRIGLGHDQDFVVESVKGPPSAEQGGSITAQVKVCNQGTQAGSTFAGVYVSADTLIEPPVPGLPPHLQDTFVGGAPTEYLEPGQCQTVSVSGPASSFLDGAYYLGAVVDPSNDQPELIEDNNATAGNRIGLGWDPDFIVESVTGPASAYQNDSITTQVKVCNQGTQPSSTYVDVYVSADAVITTPSPSLPPHLADNYLGGAPTDMLEPGQCQTLSISGPAWGNTDGAHYLGAVVDRNNYQPELIEDNNVTVGGRIGLGSDPDFKITTLSGPASASQHSQITVELQVCNQGTRPAATQVGVYVSSDPVISPPEPNIPAYLHDHPVGTVPTDMLEPGQCQTLSISGPAWSNTNGAHYLGGLVDPFSYRVELIEDNNTHADSIITLTP